MERVALKLEEAEPVDAGSELAAPAIPAPPREEIIHRTPPQTGFWAQWEAIWRRQ